MKKISSKKTFWLAMVLIIGMVAVALTGCGSQDNETGDQQQSGEQQDEKMDVAVMYSIPNPATAGGWDRAQFAGGKYLENELGWNVAVAEEVPFTQLTDIAGGYADRDFDLVVFTSSSHVESWMEVAPMYPDTWFLMASLIDVLPDSPNSSAWSPDFYVYGTIVGAVAAETTETGKISVMGGMPIPALTVMFSGIIEGAKAVNPDVEVEIAWFGDWVDVARHSSVTELQIQRGADVIFSVTGPGVNGIFEAAEAGGAHVIGYAADFYNDAPDAILTSVEVDTPKMYEAIAQAILNGEMKHEIVDLGPDYFKLSDFRGKLSEEQEQQVLDTVAKIQSGELEVPYVIHDIN